MHITRPIWTCKVTQPKSVTGWPHRANVPDLSFGLQISFSIKACSLVQVVDHKRLLLGGIFCSGLAAGNKHKGWVAGQRLSTNPKNTNRMQMLGIP